MLFTMVDPMASPTRPNDPLELVSLDPDKLFNPFVTPKLQTASRKESSLGEGIRRRQTELLGASDTVISPVIVQRKLKSIKMSPLKCSKLNCGKDTTST